MACPYTLFVPCPPAPLKGGSYSNMNNYFLKNENEPPFRGVGGQNMRECGGLGGLKQRRKSNLGFKNEEGTVDIKFYKKYLQGLLFQYSPA